MGPDVEKYGDFKSPHRVSGSRHDALVSGCFDGGASELVFWAFRYFLGRMTIATGDFASKLARAWPNLDERERNLIKRELDEAFQRDDEARETWDAESTMYPLGMDCDRAAWEKVRAAYS